MSRTTKQLCSGLNTYSRDEYGTVGGYDPDQAVAVLYVGQTMLTNGKISFLQGKWATEGGSAPDNVNDLLMWFLYRKLFGKLRYDWDLIRPWLYVS